MRGKRFRMVVERRRAHHRTVRAMTPRTLTALAAILAVTSAAVDEQNGIIYQLTDEQYYEMPTLFHLDEFDGCLATRDAYCLGSFELSAEPDHKLFQTMQRYSANWVDNFNHTRLHRGLCLNRSCTAQAPSISTRPHSQQELQSWFSSCVNTTVQNSYGLRARLYNLEYCKTSSSSSGGPLTANEKAFAAAVTTLLALAAVSTTLDLALSDHKRKGAGWALSWSLRQSWRTLTAPPASPADCDLRCFDGLRVFSMLCVIIEHVCWLATLSYLADTRYYEQIFRWMSVLAAPLALWWAALSPLLLPAGPPPRGAAAALAALERPVFAFLCSVALLGAINGVRSPWRTWLSGRGWAVCARLSFGALLLHMPLNKALIAARLAPAQIDRQNALQQPQTSHKADKTDM
ncbi:unnamed protein product, partial [Iphiclides podalirius]